MPVTNNCRYYVADFGGSSIKVIDELTKTIIGTIPVGVSPDGMVSSESNTIYVANIVSDTISIIKDNRVKNTFLIENNGLLDVDESSNRLYIGNSTYVSVNDINTGVQLFSIGGLSDIASIKLNNSKSKLYVLDGMDSKIKVYKAANGEFIEEILVGQFPISMLINSTDTVAYVLCITPVAAITVIDLITLETIAQFDSSELNNPQSILLDESSNLIYVANQGDNRILLLDADSGEIIKEIPVNGQPTAMALNNNGTKLAVTNFASKTVSIVDLESNFISTIPGISNPSNIVALNGSAENVPVSLNFDFIDPYNPNQPTEAVCIIENKVFASCQQRACFNNVVIEIPESHRDKNVQFDQIIFEEGFIVPGTELITPIIGRPNFSRVQFTLRVPFKVVLDSNFKKVTIEDFVEVNKDIVLFIPEARDEFKFDIIVETRSDLLGSVRQVAEGFALTIGIFIVVKVIGKVQLLIPAFGYCLEPSPCEEFVEPVEEDVCKIFNDFNRTPFPEDFFPPQFEDLI